MKCPKCAVVMLSRGGVKQGKHEEEHYLCLTCGDVKVSDGEIIFSKK